MNKKVVKFALLSASLLVGCAPAINANIPALAKHFNEVPLSMVEMLTTIPSLFLMISVLTSSFIAKKIGYKQTIMIGLAIVMVAGLVPLCIDHFVIILISRAMLGFGVGLFNSLLVAMINHFYDASERATMYGLQTAFEGAGGIFITFVAGQLLKINWQAPFFAYLIAIPVFIIYLKFVPKVETKDIVQTNVKETTQVSHKKGNNLPVVGYVALLFVAAVFYMIMGIKISSLITTVGYGDASDASIVIILLSLGGISAGVFFGKFIKLCKGFTASLGLLILSGAMFILAISNTMLLTLVGGFLTGFGFKLFMPSLIERINNSNLKNPSLATSLLLVGFNMGSFVSPYGSLLLQNLAGTTNLPDLFLINAIGFTILSIITFVVTIIKTKKSSFVLSLEK